jgi:hypothetical protein
VHVVVSVKWQHIYIYIYIYIYLAALYVVRWCTCIASQVLLSHSSAILLLSL